MTNSDGNRHNVLKRHYYHKFENDRAPYSRRSSGENTAQFSFDELYLLPFTHQYSEDEQGRGGFVPLEQNLHPTGINVMDEYLQMLHQNCFSYAAFRQKYHAHSSDLSGLVFMLTGLTQEQFRLRWILRTASLLLRYTDMSMSEVAQRSGAGSRTNLYYMFQRDYNYPPSQERENAERDRLWKYRIIE